MEKILARDLHSINVTYSSYAGHRQGELRRKAIPTLGEDAGELPLPVLSYPQNWRQQKVS